MTKRERIEALEAKVATLGRELAALRNSFAAVPIHVPPVMYPPMAPYRYIPTCQHSAQDWYITDGGKWGCSRCDAMSGGNGSVIAPPAMYPLPMAPHLGPSRN